MTLRPMLHAEAREAWGWIRNGLLDVIARCHATWTPEDVYVEVAHSRAYIYEIEHEGDALGFCVLQRVVDADALVLFIWALWGEPTSLAKLARDVFQELDKLARGIGAKRIRMHSDRKGWTRYMDAVSTIYEREV